MASDRSARFVWFWTFWHWSRESFRAGSLLRSPLQGIRSHWDEWYRHEASADDRRAIVQAGQDSESQRQFLAWLFRHWTSEAFGSSNRSVARFVASELARQDPFMQWASFEKYRAGYGIPSVAAIVLAEKSSGEADDIRPVEALLLPPAPEASGRAIVAEGFEPDGAELNTLQHAASSLLQGRGLFGFFGLWLVFGRRPGHRPLHIVLTVAWLATAAMIAWLWAGPDPREGLVPLCAALGVLWLSLVTRATWVVSREGWHAWRQGRAWAAQLERGQVRLRMAGGLHLQGASAGLAFCLNTLLALFRTDRREARPSWIWQQSLGRLSRATDQWAATGVLTPEGWLKPVVLEPKLRACLHRSAIHHILTPHQGDARQGKIAQFATALPNRSVEKNDAIPRGAQLGYAATVPPLKIHPSRHLAQVMMAVGGLASPFQFALNLGAIAVSVVMICATPDLVRILFPAPAPAVVGPGSASPYYLWVSLDTNSPRSFRVQLESDYWANRLAEVKRYGGSDVPPRAEIIVHRLPANISGDGENGTIWIERRHSFLNREFFTGERVGWYPLSYVTRLRNE